MAPPGVELFVAARADGVVPALVVGLGGVWTEALDDVAIIPLPASAERVARAIGELRGAALLDLGAVAVVAEAGVAVGALLIDEGLTLLELNPLSVGNDGALALDAVARR